MVAQDIKDNQFRCVYLFFGAEVYLRNLYKNKLKDRFVSPDDNLNYSHFEGAGVDPNEVADLVNTMPFLSDRRVIIVENTGWMNKEGSEEGGNLKALCEAIENMSEDVLLILNEEKADKRSKLYKTIAKKGSCEAFELKKEEDVIMWAAKYLQGNGKKIRENTLRYFIGEVGTDMMVLSLEMDKLIMYCLDREEITMEDVNILSTHQLEGQIFAMIEAIGAKRQKEALSYYHDLLALHEPPFAILSLLSREYRRMVHIKSALSKNIPRAQIAAGMGLQDWQIRKTMESASKISMGEIKRCLEACAKADEDIKNGNLPDVMSVELLILECSKTVAKVQ